MFTKCATESLAAIAAISAQETIPGHCSSKVAFAVSMTSYPRTVRFGSASFSTLTVPLVGFGLSNNKEASHPYVIKD